MMNKQTIITVAADLIIQRGIRNVSLDDVSKTLGISKKTIYAHFSDKSNLLFEVFANEIDSMTKWMQQAALISQDSIEEFVMVGSRLIDWLMTWHSTSLADLQASCLPAFELCRKFKNGRLKDFFWRNRERGIKEDRYHSNWNADMIIANAILMFENCSDFILEKKHHLSPLSIKHYFIAHFLFGLCRPASHKEVAHHLEVLT